MQEVFNPAAFRLPTAKPQWVENFKMGPIDPSTEIGQTVQQMRLAKCGETGIRVAGIRGNDSVCFSIKEVGTKHLDVAMYIGDAPEVVAKAITNKDNYLDASYKTFPLNTNGLVFELLHWYHKSK